VSFGWVLSDFCVRGTRSRLCVALWTRSTRLGFDAAGLRLGATLLTCFLLLPFRLLFLFIIARFLGLASGNAHLSRKSGQGYPTVFPDLSGLQFLVFIPKHLTGLDLASLIGPGNPPPNRKRIRLARRIQWRGWERVCGVVCKDFAGAGAGTSLVGLSELASWRVCRGTDVGFVELAHLASLDRFMCAQDNSRLVNTCNGFYCDQVCWVGRVGIVSRFAESRFRTGLARLCFL